MRTSPRPSAISSPRRSGILAGGNWIVDKLKVIDTYPTQDALANILGESAGNGGSPFNILVDLAKLGATFPLNGIGLVGNDADGAWMRGVCVQHNIGTDQLHTHATAHTSYTDVMTVKSTGRRTFFHQRGANAFLAPKHFDFSACTAKIFHLGYLLLLDELDKPHARFGTVAAGVLKKAQDAGLKTCVDVVSEDGNRFSKIVRPALRFANYCFLNELEAERTTGIQIRRADGIPDESALVKAAKELLAAGVQDWVIIHFPGGAFAASPDGKHFKQGSVKVPQKMIEGTAGAGDAFAAGVLSGIHDGEPMQDCLRMGVCAAAASLSRTSCSDGIKGARQCLELGKKYGYRAALKAGA